MEKDLKRKSTLEHSCSSAKKSFIEVDLDNLPTDPGQRLKISDYHPNDRENIRRAYMLKGPCQPLGHNFSQKQFGNKLRRFNPQWFKEYGNWLEYSVSKEAAFCLCCYLMRPEGKHVRGDAFVIDGFSNWKEKSRLQTHVGGPNSVHNVAWRNCVALMNQKQDVGVMISNQSNEAKSEYRIHLTATIDCVRFLLRQGLAFRGCDESGISKNQGNFLELLEFLAYHNEKIDKVFNDARGNIKLVAPSIQKDIVSVASTETTCAIINDLGTKFFSILVDESCDVSIREQMAIVLRYVNDKGSAVERFMSLVDVPNTTSSSLMDALRIVFAKHALSFSKIRGQSYYGASNIEGEFNGFKRLILRENKSAFYVHCSAHQLQLSLVAVAEKQVEIALLSNVVAGLVNLVGVLRKRKELFQSSHLQKVEEALKSGEISSGRGLNQEATPKKAGDICWGSHFKTIANLIHMFSSVINVLEVVEEDGHDSYQRAEACKLLNALQCFEFVFNLHLMKSILGVTNELSQALQRSDQDIVNAIHLVSVSKKRLKMMRDDGWPPLHDEVSLFCEKNNIDVLKMEDSFVAHGRSRRKVHKISNLQHFQVELFHQVIDRQLQELNSRFTEENIELLLCVACLSPRDSFIAFDKEKLVRLAQLYPHEFSSVELILLDSQLQNYIVDVRSNKRFDGLKRISDLSEKMVETMMHNVYPLVYLLLELALVLAITTASVQRSFSTMNITKSRLRNCMGDAQLNGCLVTCVEKEIFDMVDNEKIMQRFQKMRPRMEQL